MEAFLYGGLGEEDGKARWDRCKKCAFRLCTVIQGQFYDQIALLLGDLEEALVRLRLQKERQSKEQHHPAPSSVPQGSSRDAEGEGLWAISSYAAAVSTVPAVGGTAAEWEGTREDLEEKLGRQRQMFEILEEVLIITNWIITNWRSGKQNASPDLARWGEEPLPELSAVVRRSWGRWLEIPKSSPAYKKACIFSINELAAFSTLNNWLAESISFTEELNRAVTGMFDQAKIIVEELHFNPARRLLHLDEEGRSLENEAGQGRPGSVAGPEPDVADGAGTESKSAEGSQSES